MFGPIACSRSGLFLGRCAMNMLILGAGPLGSAIAEALVIDPKVTQVILTDSDRVRLDASAAALAAVDPARKLTPWILDPGDLRNVLILMRAANAVVSTLPWEESRPAIVTAAEAGAPIICLDHGGPEEIEELRSTLEREASLAVVGCCSDPGLAGIIARHIESGLDRIDSVEVASESPTAPLRVRVHGERNGERQSIVVAIGRHADEWTTLSTDDLTACVSAAAARLAAYGRLPSVGVFSARDIFTGTLYDALIYELTRYGFHVEGWTDLQEKVA